MFEDLKDSVSTRDVKQKTVEDVVRESIPLSSYSSVLDVGCGRGDSVDFFKALSPEVKWIGLDIQSSPEVKERTRTDARFLEFDGVNIPLKASSIDLAFSRQSLEHARKPIELIGDIFRILTPAGFFVGQTSHLEPYHSFQFWNFTPWGLRGFLLEAGFRSVSLWHGIDGLTLVRRGYEDRGKQFNRFFTEESPFNVEIDSFGRSKGLSNRQINYKKLSICGQFCFLAIK